MIIQYGINRRKPGSKSRKSFEHQNHTIEIDGINFTTDHAVIVQAIIAKHPGWSITGYGEKKESDGD